MKHQIELRHITYFLAVAEALHFRKAAERLFISQPGLSRQIKYLETELGVVLFERHSRKVVLTKAGQFLKAEFTAHLNSLQHSIDNAKLLQDGKKGMLRVGYVGSAMQNVIPELLVKFKNKQPGIVFNLKELDNKTQLDNLQAFTLDVGFVRLERVPPGLVLKPILKENFCLVLPKNHKITSKTFKSLHQFKNEPFILFDSKYSSSYFENVMQIFNDCGFTPIISHNTIHSSSIFKLVEHGFGLSIIPKSLAKKRGYKVQFIELSALPQQTVLSLVWHKKNSNPLLDAVLKLV